MRSFKEQLSQYESDEITTTVTVKDAAGVQRTQDDQVEELIDSGCNVLCVNLGGQNRSVLRSLILPEKTMCPIIFFNREPVAEDLMQWSGLYYVGAYAEQSRRDTRRAGSRYHQG